MYFSMKDSFSSFCVCIFSPERLDSYSTLHLYSRQEHCFSTSQATSQGAHLKGGNSYKPRWLFLRASRAFPLIPASGQLLEQYKAMPCTWVLSRCRLPLSQKHYGSMPSKEVFTGVGCSPTLTLHFCTLVRDSLYTSAAPLLSVHSQLTLPTSAASHEFTVHGSSPASTSVTFGCFIYLQSPYASRVFRTPHEVPH